MPHVATEASNSALAFVLAGGCTLEAAKKFKVTYGSLWRRVSRARRRDGSKMHEKIQGSKIAPAAQVAAALSGNVVIPPLRWNRFGLPRQRSRNAPAKTRVRV